MSGHEPLLRAKGLAKSFPGVRALRGVDLDLQAGEVHALLGENGAGKSTLIRLLAGIHRPDAGDLVLAGRRCDFRRPADALAAGIAVVHQEFSQVPAMTVAENLLLGSEASLFGLTSRRRDERIAADLLRRVGVDIDPSAPVRSLSVAQQQALEIARVLLGKPRVVIMDEPTAALTPREVEQLFVIIRELRASGVAILYVSHRLGEIEEICDRFTVLRDGAAAGSGSVAGTTRREIIGMMVGRALEEEYPRGSARRGEVVLRATRLVRGRRVAGVSLELRAGEVLCLAGLAGSGRTEVARLLFGADRPDSGTIEVGGKIVKLKSPRDAIRAGICLIPEDRKSQGLVIGHSIRANFALPNMARFASLGVVSKRREGDAFSRHSKALGIRAPHPDQPARLLSGGNQQKVVLAKWLEGGSRVMIFDEPTRGIDVGAKAEIYRLMNALAAAGKAILMISSDLPEVLGMADRILVMHEGRIRGEVTDPRTATQSGILEMAIGG